MNHKLQRAPTTRLLLSLTKKFNEQEQRLPRRDAEPKKRQVSEFSDTSEANYYDRKPKPKQCKCICRFICMHVRHKIEVNYPISYHQHRRQ